MSGPAAVWYNPIAAVAQLQAAAPATVIAPGPQGVGNQFVAFHDGTIDPTMHKIEEGIATA